MKVTVLTPTYNRDYCIKNLYISLCKQTSKNFTWLIIDDGSKDNTKELIDSFKKENKIKIEYVLQNNGGKHRALNNGIKRIKDELTIIVDSDDWLTEDAIEKILYYGKKYYNKENIACISFHRKFPDNSFSGPHYREKEFEDNLIDYRINKNIKGEGSEVFFTKILKEYKFIEIPGEKFLSEGYSWLRMALKYNTIYIDEAIYVFDYLPDGLTNNIKKLRYNNPKGVVEVSKICFNKRFNFISKIKAMIRYIAYGKIAHYSIIKLYNDTPCKILFLMLFPMGRLYYFKCKI